MMPKFPHAVVAAALCASPVFAAEKDVSRPKVYTDIVACRAVTDAAARLSCFDAAAKALEDATENRQIVTLDQNDVRRTKRSLFGFAVPNIPFFGESDAQQKEEFKEIEGELANVRALPYGNYQFTVPDAGTWQTTEAVSIILKNGKKFKIKRSTLGGYMLVVNTTGIRVKRVS
jgi:hypothetical protein